MREAVLYEKLNDSMVKCLVCNHTCTLKVGQVGLCGVRKNIDGIMFSLNYGKTISRAIDPIEKKPLYHFLPNTKAYSLAAIGCNFFCPWCQNHSISQAGEFKGNIIGEEISPAEHVDVALKYNCKSIAYTYSEPTVYLEYALDIMKLAHQAGLKNLWISNGYMTKESLELILPLVDAFNIDLKGFDESIHKKLCGGSLKPILNNLKTINASKKHLEITTLVVTGFNDDLKSLAAIAEYIFNLDPEIVWHITRYFPTWKYHEKSSDLSLLIKAKELALAKGLKYVYLGNV
jgi:pyruvate formate lyase activating enzyme